MYLSLSLSLSLAYIGLRNFGEIRPNSFDCKGFAVPNPGRNSSGTLKSDFAKTETDLRTPYQRGSIFTFCVKIGYITQKLHGSFALHIGRSLLRMDLHVEVVPGKHLKQVSFSIILGFCREKGRQKSAHSKATDRYEFAAYNGISVTTKIAFSSPGGVR